MTGNPAVKVSLITCDLKSMSRPNGHSVTYAQVYNNPKSPLRSCHKITGMAAFGMGPLTWGGDCR